MSWVSVNVDRRQLPELNEPVFLYDQNTGRMWIGCRALVEYAGSVVWTNSYGDVQQVGDGWECESEWDDDYQPTHFQRFPKPPVS